ncbi:MAG: oligoendopeptidase F [Actinomycetota bacterium]|jgi:oligoendopeptidase F|nr:oligoendopeptidase F [Actinomycetota bacterium]
MKEVAKLPVRNDVPAHLRWKTEDIFADFKSWEKTFSATQSKINIFSQFQGSLSGSIDNLYKTLNFYTGTAQAVEKLFFFAHLKKDEDNGNSEYQGMLDRAQGLLIKFETESAWLIPEILSLPSAYLKQASSQKRFADYRHFLGNLLRKKSHVLTSQEEKILALSGDMAQAPRYIFSMINDADIKFPAIADDKGRKVELTKGNYIKFMENRDRKVRKKAFTQLYKTYRQQKNTIASTLSFSVKKDLFFAQTRQYSSSLEMALFEDNIPLSVYDNLIDSVHQYLPSLHQYIDIKKQALGQKKLHAYDLYVPLAEEMQDAYSYPQAIKTVKDGLSALGTDYMSIIELALDNRWIDVAETKNKTSGAYSWGCYSCHPFILLNYQNNLDSIFTIAHELGHSVHSYLSNQRQPYINSAYSIFLAEIASTLNEIKLTEHLLNHYRQPKKKLYILNHYLEQFRNTVFRQTMFAEFEKQIHQMVQTQQPLTYQNLSDIYSALNKKYYGPHLVMDQGLEMEWARIPHFYNSFYVYKYATGFCAASAISQQIKQDGAYLKQYLDFLASGGSDYPIVLLKKIGIDMTQPQPVNLALKQFSKLVGQLENLI